MTRVGHPWNVKRGWICKGNKVGRFISLYKTPSQSQEEFKAFFKNVETNLNHVLNQRPDLIVVMGGFNARCSDWWKNDIDNTSGSNINFIITSYGSSQIKNEPTHILLNCSSCIDLILTSNHNIVRESYVYFSHNPSYYHQTVLSKVLLPSVKRFTTLRHIKV